MVAATAPRPSIPLCNTVTGLRTTCRRKPLAGELVEAITWTRVTCERCIERKAKADALIAADVSNWGSFEPLRTGVVPA